MSKTIHLPKKILIIGPAWIGDIVMSQSLFQLLHQHNPGVILHVIAPTSTYPLLAFMPEVDKGILFEAQHRKLNFWKRIAFGRSLQNEKYDQAIVLTNSWKSALIPFAANIPIRTGWKGEQRFILLNDIRPLDKKHYPLMHERFGLLGIEKNARLPELNYPRLTIHSINERNPKVLALCPGAEYGPAKRWPAEYYAAVAEAKIKEGWEVWLFGSPKEREAGALIQAKTNKQCINLIGKTSLEEAINLLARVDAIVCNDSGLMHIGAALDKPLIALFGSSSPTHTPPLSKKASILYLKLECSPCFQRECPLIHLNCLKMMKPEQVLEQLALFAV
jgi:heptosyltransferase-2